MAETWFNSSVTDSCIVSGLPFSIFRCDRKYSPGGGTGGGVCILVKEATVAAIPVPVPPHCGLFDICAVDVINLANQVRFITVYRPPSSDTDPTSVNDMTVLIDCLQQLCDVDYTVVINGDFNLPNINWSYPIILSNDNMDHCSTLFTNFMAQNVFDQLVNDVTRPSSVLPGHGSIIDVVLCNDPFTVHDVFVGSPFSTSDHCVVTFELSILSASSYSTMQSIQYRNFKLADWEAINDHLSCVDWSEAFTICTDAEQYAMVFYDTVYDSIDRFVPLTRCYPKGKRCPKGINYPIRVRKLRSKKRAAWRLYRKFKKPNLLAKFKKISSDCRKAVHMAVQNHEESVIASGNLGKFFRFANSKFNARSNVGPLKLPNGSLTTDPAVKAELLSDYFHTVFTVDDCQCPNVTKKNSESQLSSIVFTPQLVSRVLCKLRTHSAGGPDDVPPAFLKRCRLYLATPLAFLYQLFFDSAYLPPVWLQAYITPIYKKGDATLTSNYRPISLTCSLCKIMESIIKDQLVKYLVSHKLISKEQHAFIAKHSTISNLLECTHDWAVSLHSKNPVDVLYIDFSRAFDSVVHNKLIVKLQSFGICGSLLLWITAFLSGRTQCVTVEWCFSSWINVLSGVPQGSVLGPILFLLFVDDIGCICSGLTKHSLFADDLKLYTSVQCSGDVVNLQNSLVFIKSWCIMWQLTVNVSKCHVLHLGYNNPGHIYCYDQNEIPAATSVCDLGVDIDSSLKYDRHISRIVSKSYSRIGILFRGFATRNVEILKKAFTVYIRPVLEYASNIWSPCYAKYINSIENVQRHFTKRISSISHLPYQERLAILELEPLELRRLKSDLTLYYKILNNHMPWPSDQYFAQPDRNCPILTRSAPEYLQTNYCRTKQFANEFFNRCVSCFNSLPQAVIRSNSVATFKRNLCAVDFSRFLQFCS